MIQLCIGDVADGHSLRQKKPRDNWETWPFGDDYST